MHPMRSIVEMFLQEHRDHLRAQREVNRQVIDDLAYLKRKIDMSDANLDAIVAALPALQNAVAAGSAQIATLSQELAGLNPTDPRSAQIVSQIQSMTTQMQGAVSSVQTAAGSPATANVAGTQGVQGATGGSPAGSTSAGATTTTVAPAPSTAASTAPTGTPTTA